VATSSVRKRRWLNDGAAVHHLIDPRTGLPAASGAAQCSAIADTAEHAEVAAKVGLIVGASSLDEDHALGRALGVRGIAWITRNGEYVASAGWKSHAVAQ
jgi:thiamine biosynthesis lipoprotein